jgi:hypothetical protein
MIFRRKIQYVYAEDERLDHRQEDHDKIEMLGGLLKKRDETITQLYVENNELSSRIEMLELEIHREWGHNHE